MRPFLAPLLLLACLSCAPPAAAPPYTDEIEQLIRSLSDPAIDVRDDAEARLRSMGDLVAERVARIPRDGDVETAGRLQRVLLQPTASSVDVIVIAHMRLAERYYQSGDYDRAAAECQSALDLVPACAAARELMAELTFIGRGHGRIR